MSLSRRCFGAMVLASMFLAACGGGGGGGDGSMSVSVVDTPILADSPGKIAGLGSFGGTPQGAEFPSPRWHQNSHAIWRRQES